MTTLRFKMPYDTAIQQKKNVVDPFNTKKIKTQLSILSVDKSVYIGMNTLKKIQLIQINICNVLVCYPLYLKKNSFCVGVIKLINFIRLMLESLFLPCIGIDICNLLFVYTINSSKLHHLLLILLRGIF